MRVRVAGIDVSMQSTSKGKKREGQKPKLSYTIYRLETRPLDSRSQRRSCKVHRFYTTLRMKTTSTSGMMKSLLILYFGLGVTQSFVLVKNSQFSASQLTSQTSLKAAVSSRRTFFLGTAGLVAGIGTCHPDQADALKPRDEKLCGTGFFTNIAQWKCTDIGDILDEGQSKALDAKQESSTDSLMSKMNLSFDDNDGDSGSNKKGSSSTVGDDKQITNRESQN